MLSLFSRESSCFHPRTRVADCSHRVSLLQITIMRHRYTQNILHEELWSHIKLYLPMQVTEVCWTKVELKNKRSRQILNIVVDTHYSMAIPTSSFQKKTTNKNMLFQPCKNLHFVHDVKNAKCSWWKFFQFFIDEFCCFPSVTLCCTTWFSALLEACAN
jgi:hypothetical protein